jgi:hypothetical protein
LQINWVFLTKSIYRAASVTKGKDIILYTLWPQQKHETAQRFKNYGILKGSRTSLVSRHTSPGPSINGNENLPMLFIPRHVHDILVALGKVASPEDGVIRDGTTTIHFLNSFSFFYFSELKTEYLRIPELNTDL